MKTKKAQAIEITTFKLNNCTVQQFISANADVDAFLFKQKGFQSRQIIEVKQGIVADILVWDTVKNGRTAMHRLMVELADSPVHGLIDQGTVDWNIAPIEHAVSLPHE